MLLIPHDAVGPDVEIGWRLVRHAWGKAYATEAARQLLAHAFQTVGLGRVVADVDPRNARSIRVATKLGMRPMPPMARRDHDNVFWQSFVINATGERGAMA